MNELDIHAFGVEIVSKKLIEGGWTVVTTDALADRRTSPQITGLMDGESAFFVVRTDVYPNRGRIEGEEVFQSLVRHANEHSASCYFASVSIANSEGKTEEEMSIPIKGVAYHVAFDGLVRMALPPEVNSSDQGAETPGSSRI